VRDLLGGVEGCTHLVDMLGPVANTAYQTVFPWRARQYEERLAAEGKAPERPVRPPKLIDSCHAFAADGEVVKRYWPDYYAGMR
jgi:Protein of unknown function (DUF2889)